MEFPEKMLESLAEDGISFTREKDGSLCYTANYEHVVATVYPDKEQFILESQVCNPDESGKIGTWGFNEENDDPEQLLRDIAEAAGNLDLAYENMFGTLVNYV